jgi:hypothetical protein
VFLLLLLCTVETLHEHRCGLFGEALNEETGAKSVPVSIVARVDLAQVTPGPSSNQSTAIASFAVSAKSFDGRPTRPWRALYRSVSVQNPLRDLSSITATAVHCSLLCYVSVGQFQQATTSLQLVKALRAGLPYLLSLSSA